MVIREGAAGLVPAKSSFGMATKKKKLRHILHDTAHLIFQLQNAGDYGSEFEYDSEEERKR